MTMPAVRPDAAAEVRLTALHSTRGKNYWSMRPVTRMDLLVGAYEDISSADVPGATERLLTAMPGLLEHRCSIGERGGFVVRLRRGTYIPHIIEHVALELQTMMGHDVRFGRAEPDLLVPVLEYQRVLAVHITAPRAAGFHVVAHPQIR